MDSNIPVVPCARLTMLIKRPFPFPLFHSPFVKIPHVSISSMEFQKNLTLKVYDHKRGSPGDYTYCCRNGKYFFQNAMIVYQTLFFS